MNSQYLSLSKIIIAKYVATWLLLNLQGSNFITANLSFV